MPGGFTLVNWRTHPWQMWGLLAIGVWAVAALSDRSAYLETLPESEINNPAMVNLFAAGMLVGTVISMLGLHSVDEQFSAWCEASGYFIIIVASSIYVFLVFYYLGPQAALVRAGTATTSAYVLAMVQRLVQIGFYLRSARQVHALQNEMIQQIKSAQ